MNSSIVDDGVTVNLGELVDIKTGKLDSNRAEERGKYPFFTCAPNPLRINDYAFDIEAILLAGNNADGIFHLNYYKGKFNAYQRTYVITVKNQNELDLRYLFYYLQLTLNLMRSFSQGTSTKFLTMRILYDLEIAVPSIERQKEISKTLSDLDDQIKNNQQMNKNLEAIGEAIFKRWFVDFEFPNEEGKPYKSSGGEMVDSEIGKIPKDWKVGYISDFGSIICGKTPPKSVKKYFGGPVPFIKIPDMHDDIFIVKTADSLTKDGEESQKNKTIPPFSICVSCIATIGLVCLSSEPSQTNQQINSIIPFESSYINYLFFSLKSMKDLFLSLGSGGTTTLNMNTNQFSNVIILKPVNSILETFQILTTPLFEKVLNNLHEIQTLTRIRDSLLPKLMSGKIRVKVSGG
jgi:type I restriction enzyme S subunit